MDVTVLSDRVIIEKVEAENTSAGGIVLAGASDNPNSEGTVLLAGEGRKTKDGVVIPLAVKVGDRIMYVPGTGIPIKLDGKDLLVVKEENILGVYNDN